MQVGAKMGMLECIISRAHIGDLGTRWSGKGAGRQMTCEDGE